MNDLAKNNYWHNKGLYQTEANELEKLIPVMGEVENAEQRPELERFRNASNCYYDLFNNGGFNRMDEIVSLFDIDESLVNSADDECFEYTEHVMDEIVLDAFEAEFPNE